MQHALIRKCISAILGIPICAQNGPNLSHNHPKTHPFLSVSSLNSLNSIHENVALVERCMSGGSFYPEGHDLPETCTNLLRPHFHQLNVVGAHKLFYAPQCTFTQCSMHQQSERITWPAPVHIHRMSLVRSRSGRLTNLSSPV